ncbi:MAG: methyltransferase [Gemmataceae bacterium]|nr:methyltransferase [Gemmataceae bacterium]
MSSASTPQEQMRRLLAGTALTQAVHVAAKLGLADLLAGGPRTAADLAAATGTHAGALYRLLRTLAGEGIFAEDGDGRFRLTPLAECLRSDVPGSQRALAIVRGAWQYRAWGELLHSVQTGQPVLDRVCGAPLFEFLAQDPERARLFDESMVGVHGRETEAMLEVYDFSGVRVLADLGGGNGSLLGAVLQRYPQMRGILFDLPGGTERARDRIAAVGLTDRCEVRGGNFFEAVPAGADAYLLRHVLHDWDDERSLRILANVRAALGEGGKLLVVECVIPAGNEPSFGKILDLSMLVLTGGLERTEEQWRALLRAGGFRVTRLVPTRAEVSVIECARE